METNLSRLLNFLPALVLVGFMIGCGGSTTPDNKLPKGDGKKVTKSKAENNSSLGEGNQSEPPKPENNSSQGDGKAATDTANKPKAKKFTPEMVKVAMEAALRQLPDLFTKEELAEGRARMMEPGELQRMTDKLNEIIVDGKADDKDQGFKVDAITVEALTKAFVVQLSKAKKRGDEDKNSAHAGRLASNLVSYAFTAEEFDLRFPDSDKWCDAILREVGNLAIFYSPQHPDGAKLKAALPKSAVQDDDGDPLSTPPGKGDKPKPLPEGKRVSHYAMNKVMGGKEAGPQVEEVVLVFECDLGWNGAGGLEDALKYMDKHKLEKIAVATSDDWRVVTKDELKKLKWEVAP